MNNNPNHLQRALDLSTNKLLLACAGAGKTYTLAKRYCAILDDFIEWNKNVPPFERLGFENILVITFTKKAAAEMAERIYSDLNLLINCSEMPGLTDKEPGFCLNICNTGDEEKLWLRSTFQKNAISTIDSFCAGVIKEHADIIGLDPQFRLEEEDSSYRYFSETLEDFLNGKSKEFDSDLKILLENTTVYQVYSYFKYLYQYRLFLDCWIEEIKSNTVSNIQDKWINKFTPEFDDEYVLQRLKDIAECFNYSPEDDRSSYLLSNISKYVNEYPAGEPPVIRRRFMILNLISLLSMREVKRQIPDKHPWE
jgi:ATP-dependent exoDNAse (exonuclease V) beta subunit